MTTPAEKMSAIRIAPKAQGGRTNGSANDDSGAEAQNVQDESSPVPRPWLTGLFDLGRDRPRKYAILLIDASFDLASSGKDSTHELEEMTAVLKAARANDVQVYEFEMTGEFHTHPQLKALKGGKWESFIKTGDDAFESTPIRSRLKREGITDVIMMGAYHDRCVQIAAYSAHRAGFNIITSPMVTQGKAAPDLHSFYTKNATVVSDGKDLIDMLSGKVPPPARKVSAPSENSPWMASTEV